MKIKKESVILVTGASSGIGKEIAKSLIAENYVVYAAARRLEKMDDIKKLGAIPVKMDITLKEDVDSIISKIQTESGGVDVLVNNAGFGCYGAVEDTSIEDARYQFEVNLFGLARVTKAVIPQMREQHSGHIVNISSMGGKIYMPMGSWYHASKHALEGWSDCLRLELAQFGIHVVIIEPGAIQTEFGSTMLGPMMERSGSSDYSQMARIFETATRKSYAQGAASPPSVIAKVVIKALRARKPKPRYATGKLARPVMFLRKWFGDRIYDKAIMSQLLKLTYNTMVKKDVICGLFNRLYIYLGMAIVSLICGILSWLLASIFPFGLAIVGALLGLIVIRSNAKNLHRGRRIAYWGLIISAAKLITDVAILLWVLIAFFINPVAH